MKNYKGMTRNELIAKIVEARVEECKAENAKKFGDNLPRKNENPEMWKNLYKTYPITSRSTPAFSLSAEYNRFYNKKGN